MAAPDVMSDDRALALVSHRPRSSAGSDAALALSLTSAPGLSI
jgi:hypothetical protein